MIYAASMIAINDEKTEHLLFSFSQPSDTTQTPEQTATLIANGMLPAGERFDCRLKMHKIDFSKMLEQHFSVEASKEA